MGVGASHPHRRLGSSRLLLSSLPFALEPSIRILLFLSLLFFLAGVLYLSAPALAQHLLFFPSRDDPDPAPVLAGVRGRDVRISASDGTGLHAWWFSVPEAPAVLFLHGNAGHVGDREPLALGLVERGLSVLLLEYRGYGKSEGRPSEEGLALDARAGYEFLRAKGRGVGGIVIFGRSMGGAVAAGLAGTTSPDGLVLEAAFTSLEAMARDLYPFLPGFLFGRLEGRFSTERALEGVEAPVLVIHGTRDEIVPFRMGTELLEAAGPSAEWMPVAGAGHNDVHVVGGAAYFDGVADFVRGCVGGS